MPFERVQAAAPELAVGSEPRVQLGERLGAQPVPAPLPVGPDPRRARPRAGRAGASTRPAGSASGARRARRRAARARGGARGSGAAPGRRGREGARRQWRSRRTYYRTVICSRLRTRWGVFRAMARKAPNPSGVGASAACALRRPHRRRFAGSPRRRRAAAAAQHITATPQDRQPHRHPDRARPRLAGDRVLLAHDPRRPSGARRTSRRSRSVTSRDNGRFAFRWIPKNKNVGRGRLDAGRHACAASAARTARPPSSGPRTRITIN